MGNLEKVLQDLVNRDDEFKIDLAVDCFAELYPTMKVLDPDHAGMYIVYTILGTTVAADGKLTQAEYAFIKALLSGVGLEHSEEEILDMVQTCAGNRDAYQMIKDVRDRLTPEGVNTLVNLVAAICSIDDRISADEVTYIKALLS